MIRKTGPVVFLDRDEPIEHALKRFKREVDNSGILKELKDREYFMSKSEVKRIAKREAIKKYQKLRKKEVDIDKKTLL